MPAFQRGRGRAKDDRHVLQAGPHDGDVAGMISRRVLLLERVLVLLVDDDEAEVPCRREHGAASADDDLDLAARDTPPVGATFRRQQMAVQYRDLAAPPAKPL